MKPLFVFSLLCFLSFGCNNNTSIHFPRTDFLSGFQSITIPDDYSTIQQGIDAVSGLGVVYVKPGTYYENLVLHNKFISVQSTQGPWVTIIDGSKAGPVVTIHGKNGSGASISGFTLQNGSAQTGGGIRCFDANKVNIFGNVITHNRALGNGGGIDCQNVNAHMEFNIITENRAGVYGGGIRCYQSDGPISNNIISHNRTDFKGGGVMLGSSSPAITNNLITNNTAHLEGGGLYGASNACPKLMNCTIAKNSAGLGGGGFCVSDNAIFDVRDSILADNMAPEGGGIYAPYPNPGGILPIVTGVKIDYSCIKGGMNEVELNLASLTWGLNMVTKDPEFVAGNNGFYYLSQVAAGQSVESPCVDSGSMTAAQANLDHLWTRTDQAIDSGTVDMGFHQAPNLMVRLQADQSAIGTVNFLLNGEPKNAFRKYVLFASATGALPGTSLPGQYVTLPLIWDSVTGLFIQLLKSPICVDFAGVLDSNGFATAQLKFDPIYNPIQMDLFFAYGLYGPWDVVSNGISVRIQH